MALNLVLLNVSMLLLCVTALALHRVSPRFGLTPFWLFLGANVALTRILSGVSVYVRLDNPSLTFTFAGNVTIPVIIMSVFIIYVANGTLPARITIIGLIGVEALTLALIGMERLHLSLPGGGNFAGLREDTPIFSPQLRLAAASIIAFIVDMAVIPIVYQAMVNHLSRLPRAVSVGVSLLVVTMVNSVVFQTLSSTSLAEIAEFLPDDLIADVPTVLLMTPLVVLYLMRVAPRLPEYEGVENRPTLDLLLGSSRQQHISPAEVKELTRHYRHLTDNIDAIFYISNPEEPIAFYISPAFETITGYTREAYYANPAMYTDMVHEDDRHLLLDAYTIRQQGYDTIYRIRRPDGEIRWLHDRTFPLMDDDGSVYRIVGIVHDITDRQRAIEQEDMLSEHTQTIKLIREFISEATHDIKSPLTGINLSIQLLERSEDEERRQKHMENIQSQFLYISQLIDGIAALARLDEERLRIKKPVVIQKILAEVTTLIEPKLRRKQHGLQVDLRAKHSVVLGNHEDLRRAVLNLVDNAAEYSPPGGTIRITISEGQDQLRIEVADSGIGIAPEELPHIFDRYYRVRGAQHLKRDGTGLGLTIVKRVIEQHNGHVDVQSTPGAGSTFTITLPTQPGS